MAMKGFFRTISPWSFQCPCCANEMFQWALFSLHSLKKKSHHTLNNYCAEEVSPIDFPPVSHVHPGLSFMLQSITRTAF